MIKKIVIFGDVHEQIKFPYHQSTKKVLDWMLGNETINSEETILISLGDIFDTEENSGDINHSILDFYTRLKNKTKIIVEGNHDKDKEKGSALDALKVVDGVEIIKEPIGKCLEGKEFLFLPHIYTDKNGITMEERYSNLYKTFVGDFDYCLYHIMDETKSFHKKSKICDLSKLHIKKRIAGHDHNFNLDTGGNYLGSVQPNSSTEKNKTPKVYIIDLEKNEDYTVDIPLFIDYYDVTYPDNLPEINVEYPILSIHESLDKQESIDYYIKEAKSKGIENLTINRVYRKKLMNNLAEVSGDKTKTYITDLDFFNIFEKEKELSSGVATIIRKVIG